MQLTALLRRNIFLGGIRGKLLSQRCLELQWSRIDSEHITQPYEPYEITRSNFYIHAQFLGTRWRDDFAFDVTIVHFKTMQSHKLEPKIINHQHQDGIPLPAVADVDIQGSWHAETGLCVLLGSHTVSVRAL